MVRRGLPATPVLQSGHSATRQSQLPSQDVGERGRQSSVRASIEGHVGLIRGLAISMRADAESRPVVVGRRSAALIEAWADALDEAADELTLAAAKLDQPRIRRWLKHSVFLALPIAVAGSMATGVGEGVGSELFQSVYGDDDRVCESAYAVVVSGDETLRVFTNHSANVVRLRGELGLSLDEFADELARLAPPGLTITPHLVAGWQDGGELRAGDIDTMLDLAAERLPQAEAERLRQGFGRA